MPKRLLVTPAALTWEHGRAIVARAEALGIPIERLGANRLTGLRGEDARATYVRAKSTLAVVVSPPGARKLQPIPPSADFQFHLAEGCPAHCQYCYLAGSLGGPPVTRVFANLPEILEGLRDFAGRGTITSASARRANEGTTFEARSRDHAPLRRRDGVARRAHPRPRPRGTIGLSGRADDRPDHADSGVGTRLRRL